MEIIARSMEELERISKLIEKQRFVEKEIHLLHLQLNAPKQCWGWSPNRKQIGEMIEKKQREWQRYEFAIYAEDRG